MTARERWRAWRRRRLLARIERQKEVDRYRTRIALFGAGLSETQPKRRIFAAQEWRRT